MAQPRRAALLWMLLSALVALLVLTGSTYAWFTFRTDTNVTPMAGAVGNGDGNLLIARWREGPFAATCELQPVAEDAELLPLSTADLSQFFRVLRQDAAGTALRYAAVSEEEVEAETLSGTLYLKAEDSGFDVYLWLPAIDCGADDQSLAALRLGLELQTLAGVQTHIFRLDELGNTAAASAQQTVPTAGTVVSAINSDGEASYVDDPSAELSTYAAAGNEENITAGSAMLCSLARDEIAQVRYWLYLEGCDDECINPVQGAELALQLGFAGVENER